MMTSRIVVLASLVLFVCTSYSGGTFLPLHRAYPPAHLGNTTMHVARDRAWQMRIVSNFSLSGSDELSVAGIYYTKIHLGTPPREYTVEIDTGSDVLWVSCTSCIGCPYATDLGITLNFFDPDNSSTASIVPCLHPGCSTCQGDRCAYEIGYVDGSVTAGYVVTDLLHLSFIMPSTYGIYSHPVNFGCSTTRTGYFSYNPHVVDGILGLGQGGGSVVSQLYSLGVTPKVFSHCLKGGDVGGGFLVFGEVVDPRVVVYSPLIPSGNHYSVRLLSIDIKGHSLPIDSQKVTTNGVQGIIVDSGTTYTYLLESDYHSFVDAISSAVSQFGVPEESSDSNLCYLQTTSQPIEFPSVTLHFDGGAIMVLRPQDYIVYTTLQDGSTTTKPCMGFRVVSEHGYPTLGEITLKDKIIIYDIAQQRIGWVPDYDCWGSYNVNVSDGFASSSASYSQPDFHQSNNLSLIVTILLQLLLVYVNVYLN